MQRIFFVIQIGSRLFQDLMFQNWWQYAKVNGLNVYTYLDYLFLYMPDSEWSNNSEELDMLMPWAEGV